MPCYRKNPKICSGCFQRSCGKGSRPWASCTARCSQKLRWRSISALHVTVKRFFPPGGWRRSLRRRYKPIFRICGPCSMPREQSSISLGRFWSAGWRCSAHGRRMPFRWQNSPLRKLCLRQRAISNQQAGAKRAIGARSTWRRGILAITDCRLVSSGLAASGRSCANG